MNHIPVKLPKFLKHRLILHVGEVGSGSWEEHLVFLPDMFWVERHERFQEAYHVTQCILFPFPVSFVEFNKGFGGVAAKDVVFNEFVHHLSVFAG